MISSTEERLRAFIEKLAGSLTEEARVDVRPGDAWAAYPGRQPPLLTYRLADVAVIGDMILGVTAHEIAHLLFTTPGKIDFPFDVGKYPRSAHLLLNAVEDSRIERVFSEDYRGARSLFDQKQDDAYDGKVQRGFDELPAKWRFILNIDRVLHGLEPWGNQIDLEAIEAALDHCLAGMWADTTEDCAAHLEIPFRIMVELIKREKLEEEGAAVPPHLMVPPEMMGLPSDYEANAPQPDQGEAGAQSGAVSEDGSPAAEMDDGKPGGQDGGAGARAAGEGSVGDSVDDGKSGGDGGGKSEKGKGGDEFGDADAGPGDGAGGLQGGALNDKTTNIIEEMVAEELARGSNNKTIDILSYRQRQRAKDAKDVDKKIDAEKNDAWKELLDVLGRDKIDQAFTERMKRNVERYQRDRIDLDPEIRTLRSYARTVLRDNDTDRFSGNYTSGRKIKTHRLYRLDNDDMRIMEKKEAVGGKSYAVAVVVDQSSSMRAEKSQLAYRSALVFLEAFEDVVDTVAIGFSDINQIDPGGFAAIHGNPYHSNPYYTRRAARGAKNISAQRAWELKNARTYKQLDSDLGLMKAMIPELERTYSSTPMEFGMRRAVDELSRSDKEVRAIVIITDGEPNNEDLAAIEFKKARRLGIETYALYIGGRRPGDTDTRPKGLQWLGQVSDRVVEVRTTAMVPQAVYRLLRGVVRRRRYSVV